VGCAGEHVMPPLVPRDVWEWFDEHPDEYEVSAGGTRVLAHSHIAPALQRLACAAMRGTHASATGR